MDALNIFIPNGSANAWRLWMRDVLGDADPEIVRGSRADGGQIVLWAGGIGGVAKYSDALASWGFSV